MIWPPVKAWTNKSNNSGNINYVAINYGGELKKRWVIMMSVIDSSLVVKVSWEKLINSSNWSCGWDEINSLGSSEFINNNDARIINDTYPSVDSGLTIPITKKNIRPWFETS